MDDLAKLPEGAKLRSIRFDVRADRKCAVIVRYRAPLGHSWSAQGLYPSLERALMVVSAYHEDDSIPYEGGGAGA